MFLQTPSGCVFLVRWHSCCQLSLRPPPVACFFQPLAIVVGYDLACDFVMSCIPSRWPSLSLSELLSWFGAFSVDADSAVLSPRSFVASCPIPLMIARETNHFISQCRLVVKSPTAFSFSQVLLLLIPLRTYSCFAAVPPVRCCRLN